MDYLRSLSLSVGTRFHGNMLAMQAGTPAVVFPHDTRTLEMCETMGIPYCNWDKIGSEDGLQAVVKSINFSGIEFDRKRRNLARVYRDLIIGTNLTPSPILQNICEA
jgi:polysaccharide pyruvyl transferase WcaK-like protein